jgi:metal-sulfur cluster biosynthetic enzyme
LGWDGADGGVLTSTVEVVWEPPWTPEKMTEAARLMLGMM